MFVFTINCVFCVFYKLHVGGCVGVDVYPISRPSGNSILITETKI